MKISAFTTITRPQERGDLFLECVSSAKDWADEVVVVDGGSSSNNSTSIGYLYHPWPDEFDWTLIGQQFQRGYEAATGDWEFHLDTDFIFHEKDYATIRQACEDNPNAPGLTFLKHQFILPDRFNLKSRLVIAVNKGKYGKRIRFDSGGDLCQPSLDGHHIDPSFVPNIRIPFWNYDKLLKTEDQVRDDVGRMARAWHSHFGDYRLGGPDDESAYQEWLTMQIGRFNKEQELVPLSAHPRVMQETIKNLRPDQFGYNGFGLLKGGYHA